MQILAIINEKKVVLKILFPNKYIAVNAKFNCLIKLYFEIPLNLLAGRYSI